MDKKKQKKTVIKRKSDETGDDSKKQKIVMVNRVKIDDKADKNEEVQEVVEVPLEDAQQVVHTGQMVEGNFEQPVFVNMKGEPVQLGPNTVILYEHSGNPSNFAFGGMWSMDSAGRLVMSETVYDVKGEPDEESATFVQNPTEVQTQQTVEEQAGTFQQYEISSGGQTAQVEGTQEFEVAIIDNPQESDADRNGEIPQLISTEEELAALGPNAIRWLNQKYDFVVRKLQLNYDAGVKLLHSPSGCIRCVYLTTPSMQLAFNAIPQFLCVETGIEFTSTIPTNSPGAMPTIKHSVLLFLAEDGNGKSVIVSAGISALAAGGGGGGGGGELDWLLDTFKSCNPAWKQVRCVVADPTYKLQAVKAAFPSAHVTCSVWQAARSAARAIDATVRAEGMRIDCGEAANRCKGYALASLRGEHTHQQLQVIKRGIIGTGAGTLRLWDLLTRHNAAVHRLDSWLEPENYTNILHKGLERLVGRFAAACRARMQPDEFVAHFFNIATQLEEERRNYALSRLRETESLKQSPTDTITQYAYNLMSHQTKLAQKSLDDRAGRKNSSQAICKYGTSTQECSCLFSKVFRLPCRHILMLTTELKVKTHIPFEPRWTVQHCLFGCEALGGGGGNGGAGGVAAGAASAGGGGGAHYVEQVVVESGDAMHRTQTIQPQQIHQVGGVGNVRGAQYVVAASGVGGVTPSQGAPVSQVILCGGVGSVAAPPQPVITSVLSAGAVLTPHSHAHTLHHA